MNQVNTRPLTALNFRVASMLGREALSSHDQTKATFETIQNRLIHTGASYLVKSKVVMLFIHLVV